MSTELPSRSRAVEQLQALGLKEYEAKCFVGLTGMPSGTARDVSEVTDVPRTRVYEAARILESKGLIEIQHSSPQRFRAVSIEEAVDILRTQYEDRIEDLEDALEELRATDQDDGPSSVHEIWSLSGSEAIETRTDRLVDSADDEVVLIVGDDGAYSDGLCDRLRAGSDRGVDVIVGALSESLETEIRDDLPEARVFGSELEWLQNRDDVVEASVGRLLLVDREAILVSSIGRYDGDLEERAVFGSGFSNGIVVITRRMLASGLDGNDGPG